MCINNVYSDLVCSVGDYETAVHSYHQKGQKYVMRFQRSKGKGLLWHCLHVVVVLSLATVWILEEEKVFTQKLKEFCIIFHLSKSHQEIPLPILIRWWITLYLSWL